MKPKLIIFDLDGTLYDLKDVHSANYVLQVEFLQRNLGITYDEAVHQLEQNGVYPIITNKSKSATEYFARLGLDMEQWKQYRESQYDASKIDKSKAVSEGVIGRFAEICPLVLLSSNSQGNILKTLEYLKIDSRFFKTIYCSDNTPVNEPFNKKRAMQVIAQQYGVEYSEMLSIGDRYQTDVVPMLELGGHGVIVSAPQALNEVMRDLSDDVLSSNESYQIY